ncbi:MAG TPA: ABC transporter substrate-binding protein [Actinomycetota bacterium]|nr:ABC transporter substrate-binding protein [Actinomycetota bacterium]
MFRRTGRVTWLAATVALAVLAPACGPAPTAGRPLADDDTVVVASFEFSESVLLAEIYAQAIEAAGIRVERELGLGARELVAPALQAGLVEFVPEYAGSALAFAGLGATPVTADPQATHDALTAVMARRGVTVLDAAPAENQNGIAVTAATAAEYGLTTISDLVPLAPSFTFGGSVECPQRPLCLPGLESVYGLTFERFVPLDASGPLTAAALRSGQVDVGLMFTTDGRVEANRLVFLADDRGLQPAENVTPVVRRSVVDHLGRPLVDAVNAVSGLLTTEELRSLNALVAIEGRAPAMVAATWLSARGLTRSVG